MRKFRKQHRSPLYQVAEKLKDVAMEEMETIHPFTLPPWEKRVQTIADKEMTRQPDSNRAAYVAVSSSARNGVVGLGVAIKTRKRVRDDPTVETLSSTLGPRTEQNPYAAELAAMAHALQKLPRRKYHSITLWTRNKAAVLTLRNPRQQSGQEHICSVYESIKQLKRKCNKITVAWLPTGEDEELWTCAKATAKEATRPGIESTINNAQRSARRTRHDQKFTREGRETIQESGHSITRQTYAKVVRPVNTERSECACPVEDGNSEIELVYIPHQSCTIKSVRLRRSEGNN